MSALEDEEVSWVQESQEEISDLEDSMLDLEDSILDQAFHEAIG